MEIWRHVKTDSLYLVIGEASCSTNGERDGKEKSVLYYSLKYQRWFYRESSEFYDGRFVKVDAPEWQGKQPKPEKIIIGVCDECSGRGMTYFLNGKTGIECEYCSGTGRYEK